MARKTPDHTKQGRKKRRPGGAAGRSRGSAAGSRDAAGSRGTARSPAVSGARRRRGAGHRQDSGSAARTTTTAQVILWLCYLALAASAGLFVHGAVASFPDMGPTGIAGRDAIVAGAGVVAGLITDVFLFLLVNTILDGRRRVLRAVDARLLLYCAVFFGMSAGLLALSARTHMVVLGAGYTLPLTVFLLAVRPHLRGARATGDGAAAGR